MGGTEENSHNKVNNPDLEGEHTRQPNFIKNIHILSHILKIYKKVK